MSGTPAAHLARIKTQHPTWRIVRVDDPEWSGYRATRGGETVTAVSLAALECELAGR